ncbi:adenosine deaminase [Pseudoclavibacter chungangensis]|uniref:adenosine deaminase n=1 Tax=Pseudoclavibacter chungangensis TaxID=587635 RepID=A0A7J5BZ74_9MICO|nr:adenosine deaminase [Pseudoclavibacter chungangensis]KAB1659444.1 adenosine deaminase [Pseudoclavibacter chungangensis]NYJ67703.1 adenosine deaminase [Pseudoclavibacter chungangensis]
MSNHDVGDEHVLPDGTDIASLPKVSLHDHLDGGLRPQTIIELADEIGIELPSTDAPELAAWFADQSDSGSLVEYLKTFDVTTAVMQTRQGLRRVARDFVNDLGADGVVYGEVRWAPEQHLARGLSLDEAVEAVQEGIEQGIDDVRHAGRRPVRVGQLVSAMRHAGDGREIAELALRHRDRGVVGFDIAGPEAGFPPSLLQPAFDLLAGAWFPATVHAGEADGLDSIRGALLDARALRLGHGVRIAEDIEIGERGEDGTEVVLGALAQWVKDRRIALELSPSSNLQTGAIEAWGDEIEDHPFDLLYQLGFTVTVNTDNRLMSATTITRELARLADAFDYDLEDLETFQLNAAEAAFLPVEDREELTDLVIDGFDEAGR